MKMPKNQGSNSPTDSVLSDGAATYTPSVSERRGATTTFLHSGLKNADAPMLGDGHAKCTEGVSERRGTSTTFYHGVIHGVEGQTNSGGSITASRVYDSFGGLLSGSCTWQGLLGYGGSFDGYGEIIVVDGGGAYDPSTGRNLTPIGGSYSDGSRYPSERGPTPPTIDSRIANYFEGCFDPKEIGNFFGGWGNQLSFGLVDWAHTSLGDEGYLDHSSPYYKGGEKVGEIHDYAMGGKTRVASSGLKFADEYKHLSEAVQRMLPGQQRHKEILEDLHKVTDNLVREFRTG